MPRPLNTKFTVTEVCGNKVDDSIEEFVIFGFHEFITLRVQGIGNQLSRLKLNGKDIPLKFINQIRNEKGMEILVQVPIAFVPAASVYHFTSSSEQGKIESLWTVKFPGPVPGHLKGGALTDFLQGQAMVHYQMLLAKNQRVFELENSLSWRLTAPLRMLLFLLPRVSLLFSKKGWGLFLGLIKGRDFGLGDLRVTGKEEQYRQFITEAERKRLSENGRKKRILNLKYKPLVSVIVPVYNPSIQFLKECMDSVLSQSYPNFELCVYDDASPNQEVPETLQKYKQRYKQVKVAVGKENLHISEASNRAVELAKGEWLAFLDHDDLLDPDALLEMVTYLEKNPGTDVVYSDEDKLNTQGQRVEPYFKSDFNPDQLLSNNYINHFTMIRTEVFRKIGGFRKGYEGSQDHDLLLRVLDVSQRFGHVPKILYHWRKVQGSTADVYLSKSYPEKAAIRALVDYMDRNNIPGTVEKGKFPGCFRVKRDILTTGKVAVIIPFRDEVALLKKCLDSIKKTVKYPNLEVILVNNQSKEAETIEYLHSLQGNVRVLEYDEPFNFSAINNFAVKHTDAEYLLFLNNDIEAREEGWLEAMLEHIQRDEVGAVGAKLLYPDGTVQHAGVILGIGGVAGHSHKYFRGDDHGYFMRAAMVQNLSACTAACLMVKREVFESVGGFDEENLKIAFNDIDLCLKIRRGQKRIVFTPYAELVHHESKSRGLENTPEKVKRFNGEVNYMKKTWGKELLRDPYYNPNLTLEHENFSLKS